jgi:hypothetical protein
MIERKSINVDETQLFEEKTCLCNLAGHVLRLLISDWCLQTFPNDEE